MKNLKEYISEGFKIGKDFKQKRYKPKTRDELEELVKKLIKERGNEADLNDIDTSEIEDMSKLFYRSEFNGDISEWNVSKVKNMYKMFTRSDFSAKNGDLSNWDVSNVEKSFAMFRFCPIAKNPPKWYKE